MFLSSIFEKAVTYDGDTIYEKDTETEYEGKIPGTNIDVFPTPGHAHEHAALLVNTEKRKVVVAADVFWWMENEEQKTDDRDILINRKDPFTKDKKALKESRKKVLEVADWIIPGHGKIFKKPSLLKAA